MRVFLLSLIVIFLLHADDDKDLIRTTHKQLMHHIRKQDKSAIENLLKTQGAVVDQALKVSNDTEAETTPTGYAYRIFEIASENIHNPYNNDRINDIIVGSLACFSATAYAILNPGNLPWLNYSASFDLGLAGVIYLRDAYKNKSAKLKESRAYEIYKLLDSTSK